MSVVARPVLRGLGLHVEPLTAELAEVVLERVRWICGSCHSPSAAIGEKAASNRDATLAVYGPSAIAIDASDGERSSSSAELVALGRLHHRAGELALAERCYFDALEANEHYELAHLSYALLLEELGELEDARDAYLWATRARETSAGWLGVARIESALERADAIGAPLGRALNVARSISELLEVGITATALGVTDARLRHSRWRPRHARMIRGSPTPRLGSPRRAAS